MKTQQDKNVSDHNYIARINTKRLYNFGLLLLIISLAIIIVYIGILFAQGFIKYNGLVEMDKFGQVGDFIGGISGTIVSIATLIFIIITFNTQKQELEETANALKKQNETMILQQFESTFFNLLNNHITIVKSIKEKGIYDKYDLINQSHRNKSKIYEGVHFFRYLASDIKRLMENSLDKNFTSREGEESVKRNHHLTWLQKKVIQQEGINKLQEIYYYYYSIHRSSLSHYYTHLFNVVRFVDEYEGFEELNYEKSKIKNIKLKYLRILRSQLSTHEIIVLWYDSQMSFGKPFQKYLKDEDYQILKNIDLDAEIVLVEELLKQYPYLKGEKQQRQDDLNTSINSKE